MAKTTISPLKRQTIIWLELWGALILARLLSSVTAHMKEVWEIYGWTDFMTVLQWIKNKSVYRQYVQNRIDEIRQKTEVCSWWHCPGNINPVDLPLRGVYAKDLIESQLLWNGPQFLKLPHTKWPVVPVNNFNSQAKADGKASTHYRIFNAEP